MSLNGILGAALLTLSAASAAAPLPELRTEATDGGSIFNVRNASQQALTAYLIELVNYPGSSYSYYFDNVGAPVLAGGEQHIRVVNMTVGAVPDYVKMQAALYADGSTSGVPDKVTQLLERRKAILKTTQELIQKVASAKAAGTSKGDLGATLKQWADSIPSPPKGSRLSQASINQTAAKVVIGDAIGKLEKESLDDLLNGLRSSEQALASSKPAL